MKKRITIVLIAFFSISSFGQNISRNLIEKEVLEFYNDIQSDYHHIKVFERYRKSVDSLDTKDFRLLYYMNSYKPKRFYPSSYLSSNSMKMIKSANKSNFKKAKKYGLEILEKNPFDITALIYVAMSLDNLGDGKDNDYYKLMQGITQEVLKTGSGKTKENSIKISEIGDDVVIIGFTGFNGQKLESEKNEYGLGTYVWKNRNNENLFFDIVLIFD
jgi:hypothetical protein